MDKYFECMTLAVGANEPPQWACLEIEPGSQACTARWRDRIERNGTVPGIGIAVDGGLALARSARGDGRQGNVGLVEYALDEAGSLRARWAHPSLGSRIGAGAAKRTAGDLGAFAGDFRIVYRDGDGNQVGPECDLRIGPAGQAYRLRWISTTDNRTLFEGVGALERDRMLAAWGNVGEPCDLVVLRWSDAAAAPGLSGWALHSRTAEVTEERYAATSVLPAGSPAEVRA